MFTVTLSQMREKSNHFKYLVGIKLKRIKKITNFYTKHIDLSTNKTSQINLYKASTSDT
jgi:hypothetical protein